MKLSDDLESYQNNSRFFRSKSFVVQNTLFVGDILSEKKTLKRFLKENIENHMGKEIEKTKILYEYKKEHKINFHERVDNHPNLVLIVETIHGKLIAGYYSGVYDSDKPMKGEALIFSLTNERCYALNTMANNPNKDPK